MVRHGSHPLLPNRLLILEEYLTFEEKTEKRDAYLRIPSLQAYLVVEQAWRRVDLHWRNPTGVWESAIVQEGAVSTPCPETRLTLDEIYEGLPALTLREMAAIGYAVS